MRIPNLFVLGAPKCGTTTISAWLAQHPDIFFSPEKEPHYYYSPYGEPMSAEKYAELFQNAPDSARYMAEASVWYLFGGVAVPGILAENPDARFIVCLRNPVQMAPSLHAQTLYIGRELLENFEDAWKASDKRFKGEHLGVFGFNNGDPACMAYKQTCMLGQQVEKLFAQVDKEQVLFVLMDDLSSSPVTVWAQIQDFLNLDKCDVSLRSENHAKRRRFPFLQRFTLFIQNLKKRFGVKKRFGILAFFNKKNIVDQKYPELPSELKEQMKDYYRDDVKKLSQLIERDLSGWLS